MLSYLSVFLALVVLVHHGQTQMTRTIGAGECPEKNVVQNFNVSRFTGLWYETSRSLAALELGGKCPRVQYTLNPNNGEVAAVYTIIDRLTGNQRFLAAKARPADPERVPQEGRYLAVVNTASLYFLGQLPVQAPFNLLDTDYDNYAVVWSCFSVGKTFYGGGAVILSRTPVVSDEIQAAINATIQREDLAGLPFKPTDQDCDDHAIEKIAIL